MSRLEYTSVFYEGEDALGHHVFRRASSPWPTQTFTTLQEAVEELGAALNLDGVTTLSPCSHAGYNAGLWGKDYYPETRIPDGAPRPLSTSERKEYALGYLWGLRASSQT